MPGLMLESCCFGAVSLKKGCYIIAFIDLICSVTLISIELALLQRHNDREIANRYSLVLILFLLIYIVNDFNLVIGAYVGIRWLVMHWIVIRSLLALIDCLLITYIDMKMPNSLHKDHKDTFPHPMCGFLLTVVYLGIIIYEVLVVSSYFRSIGLSQDVYYTPSTSMDHVTGDYPRQLTPVPSAPPLSPLQQGEYPWYQPGFNSLYRRG